MMRRLLSPLVLALTAFACGKTASTPTPDTEYPMIQIVDCEGSSVEGAPWRKAPREDGLFSHLAERVPGFGGLFQEEDGRLAVYLIDLKTAERARRTLEWFLRREPPELVDLAHDIHWLQGQYDWRQLAVWRDCLASRYFSLVGAVSSGLDEGQNRINFGAPDKEWIAVMKMELEKTVVPQEAVIFQRRGLFGMWGQRPSEAGGPLAPTELVATTVNYHRIDLTWVDNATNEEGYRIERHQGQTDSLFTQVPSNTEAYADSTSSLLPNRQYCYRVVATNQQGESYSNEACATTDPLPSVACTTDPHDNRNKLTELLLSTDARSVGWRANVGLSGADPSALTLVENDVVCDTLWRTIRTALPSDPYSHAFFKLGDLHIVTYYPFTFNVTGPRLTAVLTEQFGIVNPVLAH